MRSLQLIVLALALVATAAKADIWTAVETLNGNCTITHTGTDSTGYGICSSGGGSLWVYSNDGSRAYTVTTGYMYLSDPNADLPCMYVTLTDEWGSYTGDVIWQSIGPCQSELAFGQHYDFYTTDSQGNNAVFSHEDILSVWINQANAVPEPSTLFLLVTAAAIAQFFRTRTRARLTKPR